VLIPAKLIAYHSCFKAPGRPLISDRDFTYVFYDRPEEYCGISYDTEFYAKEFDTLGIARPPPQSGVVRASLIGCMYMYRPVPGQTNKLHVIYVTQADVRGWIPTWVANFTATEQALNVRRIVDYFLAKHGREVAAAEYNPKDEFKPDGTEADHPEAEDGKKKKKKKKHNKKKSGQE